MSPSRAPWRLSAALFTARPLLTSSVFLGFAVWAVLLFVAHLRLSTAFMLGWDAFCVLFLTLVAWRVASEGPEKIAKRAAAQDEGRHIILVLLISMSAASLVAVAAELSRVKNAQALTQKLHVGLAVGTVAASWLVMQTVLALHYAHEYYARDPSGGPAGGLTFPGGEAPDYWDFLHFAIVIGVASQTADIAITDRTLRRLTTVHSLLAFVFNTLIIALTINLVAGLF